MDKDNRNHKEFLVNRIISGVFITKLGNRLFFVKNPTRTQKYLAQMKYIEAMNDFDFDPALTRDTILDILIKYNLVPQDVDQKIDKLEKDIELLKHQLFLNYLKNPLKFKSIKEALVLTRRMYLAFLQARHSLDHLTIEGCAEAAKMNWLFSSRLYDERDNLVEDTSILERVMVRMNSERISNDDFRDIARSEPWRSFWNANSDFVFGTPVVDWTEEQKAVVLYSRMYDSAYKSSDPPSDLIVNDDDLFDGWMIEQKKEYERSKKEKKADKKYASNEKFDKADEIYTMATQEHKDEKGKKYIGAVTSKEAINEINEMNSLESKMIKQQRMSAIKNAGSLQEQQLPDVKRDLAMQANKLAAERFSKRR